MLFSSYDGVFWVHFLAGHHHGSFPCRGGLLRGLIIGIPPLGQELIGFLFQQIGKLSIPIFSRRGYIGCAQIISPFFLIVEEYRGAKRPFKFKNMWLKAKGFVDKVRQWWSSYCFNGSPSVFLAQKLKAFKVDLKIWNEQVFGNVEIHKKALLEELCALDKLEEVRALVVEEKSRKSVVISELEKGTLVEEISWRQKSRVLWLKEGDKCTNCFTYKKKNAQIVFIG
jgi:hypothetical protein